MLDQLTRGGRGGEGKLKEKQKRKVERLTRGSGENERKTRRIWLLDKDQLGMCLWEWGDSQHV